MSIYSLLIVVVVVVVSDDDCFRKLLDGDPPSSFSLLFLSRERTYINIKLPIYLRLAYLFSLDIEVRRGGGGGGMNPGNMLKRT